MPYMKDDKISYAHIEDGIEITDEQYQLVYEAMLTGKDITVRNEQPFIYSGENRTIYQLNGGVIESKDIPTEDVTPEGWQDEQPTLPPTYRTKFSARQFLKKLTLQEKIDLKTSEDIQVQLWYDELIAADFVDIEDPDTIDATNYGVFKGIFSEARKDELLTPEIIEE